MGYPTCKNAKVAYVAFVSAEVWNEYLQTGEEEGLGITKTPEGDIPSLVADPENLLQPEPGTMIIIGREQHLSPIAFQLRDISTFSECLDYHLRRTRTNILGLNKGDRNDN